MNGPCQRDERDPGRFDASYYRNVYGVDAAPRFSIPWWANRYYARLCERLLRRRGGRALLDVGCGQGFLLGQVRGGIDRWGLEVSEYAAARCATYAPGARVLVGDIETGLPPGLPPGGFDVVVARYVLEHLADPGAAIARCADLVRPGGYFLFSVPNTTSPGRRLKGSDWFGLRDETHVSLLPPEEWLALVGRAGLRVERVFGDGLWDIPYVRRVPGLLQYAIFSAPTILAVLLVSTALPLRCSENLIAWARKPA
jgi:SAM-dependent methyltransferase